MGPGDDGVGSYPRYEDDERCPICFVPPRAQHLDSCDHQGIWDGAEPEDEPRATGGWSG